MGGIRKKASKWARKLHKAASPIGYKLIGEKAMDRTERYTAKNVWGTDLEGNPVGGPAEDPNDAAALAEATKPTEMPDEEAIKRTRRRESARRRSTGRSSTLLSGDGLGG